jgi:hypothetical protein
MSLDELIGHYLRVVFSSRIASMYDFRTSKYIGKRSQQKVHLYCALTHTLKSNGVSVVDIKKLLKGDGIGVSRIDQFLRELEIEDLIQIKDGMIYPSTTVLNGQVNLPKQSVGENHG